MSSSTAPAPERKTFLSRPKLDGLWVRLRFRDEDVMEGIVANDLLDLLDKGVQLTPPDLHGNTLRIFIPRSALAGSESVGRGGSCPPSACRFPCRRIAIQAVYRVTTEATRDQPLSSGTFVLLYIGCGQRAYEENRIMKLGDIARKLGCELRGGSDIEITGVAGIEDAKAGELTFLANRKYRPLARNYWRIRHHCG